VVYLNQDHVNHPAPPGAFGGSMCTCAACDAKRKETPEAKKQAAIKNYMTEEPNKCPYCKSEQIEGSLPIIEGVKAYQECYCNDCGGSWSDTYTLTGVELHDPVK